MEVSDYANSWFKRLFDAAASTTALLLLSPIILLICILIKISSDGPYLFIQKRTGKNGKAFKILKFRTMKKNSEKKQELFKRLNEANGPVFKIRDDPRFTSVGRLLSWTGLDEMPQLINVLRGDMSLVGPRPLPINEADMLTSRQKMRLLVRPGITSVWVVRGSHSMKFSEWMWLDQEYVKSASFGQDLAILYKTAIIPIRFLLKLLL